jgi:aspartate 1-decarboxylase
MFRTLLKSKIHRAAVTHCELNYEGSCAIDEDLLDAAIISVNGSAARRAAVGDLVIIAAFAQVHEEHVTGFSPKLVFVNPDNRIKEERSTIPVQKP